jgi:hypothetical protein
LGGWLHSFEWAALLMLLAVLIFLYGNRLGIDLSTATYTVKASLRVGVFALPVGIALQALFSLGEAGGLRRYLRGIAKPAWLLEWLRMWLAIWVTSFAYFWLKVCIPFVNVRSFDAAFARLDEALHLGLAPTRFLVEVLGSSSLAPLFDRWYDLWLLTLVVGLAFFACAGDRLLRRRVVLSSVMLWSLGAWLYLALPAVGPVFVERETWKPIEARLPRATAGQAVLWRNYQQVRTVRAGDPGSFDHRLGVAAMPSLHVGFHVLFALWLWRVSKLLAVGMAFLALLTFVGSVLTGWHYAIDGYAGALLAWLCVLLAQRLEQVQGDTEPEPRHQPSAATRATDRSTAE